MKPTQTSELDRLIEEALSAEERALFEQGGELGWFQLGLAQFRGRLGWVTWVIMIVQTVMFLASVWAGWQFYIATEVLPALKWGLTAAVLVLMATQMKMALMPQMQAERIIRELKRLELLLSRG